MPQTSIKILVDFCRPFLMMTITSRQLKVLAGIYILIWQRKSGQGRQLHRAVLKLCSSRSNLAILPEADILPSVFRIIHSAVFAILAGRNFRCLIFFSCNQSPFLAWFYHAFSSLQMISERQAPAMLPVPLPSSCPQSYIELLY